MQAGPRYAKVYQIHKTRCIFCGYCEEACPVSAIFMGKDYELAVYSNKDFIWDKDDLLVPALPRLTPQPPQPRTALRCTSARSATSTAISTASAASCDGTPRCRSGCASATWPTTQGRYEPFAGAALLDQGQQRELRRASPPGDLPANLHYLPNGVAADIDGIRVAGLGGTFAPTWYDTPAADLPHPRKGNGEGDRARRQAAAFRARGSRGLQGTERRRRVPDARGAASVFRRRPGRAGTMPGRRRSTRCSPR